MGESCGRTRVVLPSSIPELGARVIQSMGNGIGSYWRCRSRPQIIKDLLGTS